MLGYSPTIIPLIFDLAKESIGTNNFDIWKNIPVEESLSIVHQNNDYHYTIHEPESKFNGFAHPIFFGLVGSYARTKVFQYYQNNYGIEVNNYINIIHPTSYIAPSTKLDHGILIEPHVIISSQSTIGFAVTVKRGASIGHHNVIEEFTEINPSVTLTGRVHIGKNCMIGAGCTIRNGISIGENTIVGMGSVVTKDLPANVIAFGNPCKVVRENPIRK